MMIKEESIKRIPWENAIIQEQHGGDHYKKMTIQPWEIIEKNGLDYWEGNVLKYLLRWRKKGGVDDLKKAKHYLEYLIEREEEHDRLLRANRGAFDDYGATDDLNSWIK